MTFKAIFPILYALGPALALAQGKRGLAYNDGALANLFSGYSHVTWGYSWGYERNGLGASLDFNPMLWGLPSSLDPQWTAAVHATGVEAILGFNEPDLGSQSNISPADAAAGYLVSLQPFAAQVRISTPAVTNGPPPNMGTGWMDQFFEHCRTCTIDFVAIHWYANNDPEGFKAHVQQFYDKYHLPIWITEFAASGSEAEQIQFLQAVLPWLDAQPYVERYAYFGVLPGFLVNEGGDGLSQLGQLLLAIPHGIFIFQKPPVYGWYLSVSAVGLNVSWSLHNVIAWMKSKPFYSRNVSMAYIASVVAVQPYWLLEIYANFAYFNNINRVFEVTRPMEPFFRDPWWIFTTCSLFYTIKRGYSFGIVELVTVSPRFGIMLAAMCVSTLFIIIDTCSLSFVFKCLCNTVILDDFRTALDRIHTYHEQRVRASAYPAIRDIGPPANAHHPPYNANSACAPTSAEVGEIVIEVPRRAGDIA
ncbi:hypothetical protein KXV33_001945 [Aspergillus fumigatus]|nr:hypothetical protein KXV33_001945 [Aspergillus fumigatus]